MPSIFTRIIQGELPGNFVYQDELCIAIMTIQPIRPGHVLLIPKQEVDHWDDIEPQTAAHMMTVGQKIAKAQKQCYPDSRVGVIIAGMEVPHAHIHLVPIQSEGQLSFALARDAEPAQLAEIAQNLTQALAKQ